MHPSGIEQFALADEAILPLSLQETCDLYHFNEMTVQIISAEKPVRNSQILHPGCPVEGNHPCATTTDPTVEPSGWNDLYRRELTPMLRPSLRAARAGGGGSR